MTGPPVWEDESIMSEKKANPTRVRELRDIWVGTEPELRDGWGIRVVTGDQCQSYVAWNEASREAIVVDPKREDLAAYAEIVSHLKHYLWLAVIDTHTHADHVSCGPEVAALLGCPYVMGAEAQSRRVDLRVGRDCRVPGRAAPLVLVLTPGHTPDSMTVLWGPFVFGGDTVLFGDVGRDDLPGGDPAAHYSSVKRLLELVELGAILLPGHDHEGGRASTWADQLKCNASLTEPRDKFIREAAAFDGASPDHLKESLRENSK